MLENVKSLQALDELFAKIAEALGVGLEAVQQNGMEYVMMYGKYHLVTQDIIPAFWLALLVGGLVMVGIGMLMYGIADARLPHYGDRVSDKTVKKIIKGCIIGEVFIIVIALASALLPYVIAPEMYSIKHVLELLG